MVDVAVSCSCGTVRGRIVDVGRKAGSRIICYCNDCQTGARALGREELLNDRGGSEVFQTTPAHIRIDAGEEHVACLRLSPKGLMRWYAGCCNTPLFNTLAHTKLCMVGVLVHSVAPEERAALGSLTAQTFTDGASGKGEPVRKYGFAKSGYNIMHRHVRAKFRGKASMEPFFDPDGRPLRQARILTFDERNAARPE